MHARPDLRAVLKWMITRSGSVITVVIHFRFMRDSPEPKRFEILSAQAFGISELRVGRHRVRDDDGQTCGAVHLNSIWTLRIKPSFAIHGFLTVATAEGLEYSGSKTPGWRRALLRSDDGKELVSSNVAKTVEPILANIPLLVKSNEMTLDGIGYELIWQSDELIGSMQFNNPRSDVLRLLEITCLNLATSLTKQSDGHKMFNFVNEWKRYTRDGG